jgi:hypothetical protein
MRYLTLEEVEKKYIVSKVEQFDQKNDMYRRSRWQPEVRGLWVKLWEETPPQNKPGYTHKDRALENALWYIENGFALGNSREGYGLYSWEIGPKGTGWRI